MAKHGVVKVEKNMSNVLNTYNDDSPLYNIRIVRNHVDFIEKNYPDINIDALLSCADITRLQFNDSGYWCSQRQINKFVEAMIKQTGNKEITKDTGRHLMTSQNTFAQYVLGFMSPASISFKVAAIYSKMSRGVKIGVKKLEKNKFEFIAKPKPGVNEQEFQCVNRIGSLEGVYKLINGKYPRIEHPECWHHGATHCRYIVSWDKPSGAFKWLRIRNYSILMGTVIALLTLFFSSLDYFFVSSFVVLLIFSTLSYYVHFLEKRNVEELGKTSKELLDESTVRYNVTKLLHEMGEITSIIQNEKEISSAVCKVMRKRLEYERGVIFLADTGKRYLVFVGGYGFSDNEISVVENIQFRIDNLVSDGIFQKVLREQQPIVVDSLIKTSSEPEPENLNIAKILKMKSLVCAPIVHEGESLGIIAVGNLESSRDFREGDKSLLMAVAFQTALSIAHARAFRKLQESERKHRTFLETIRDIVYTVDLDGRFTYVSPMVEVITGYTDSELCGRHFSEIVTPHYKDTAKQRFTESLETGETSTYQIDILAKDGTVIPVEVNSTPLIDTSGQPIGRIGVARDIGERRQAEKELEKHRENLEMKTTALQESNIALQVMLKRRDEEKAEYEIEFTGKVEKLIKPYIAKLEKSKLSDSQKNTLNLIGQNLDAITSPFLYDQLSLFIKLTAKEIQISNLIKQGLSTKEIASTLDLSVRTVETHRYQIRKKMGIKDKKVKLRDKLLKTY